MSSITFTDPTTGKERTAPIQVPKDKQNDPAYLEKVLDQYMASQAPTSEPGQYLPHSKPPQADIKALSPSDPVPEPSAIDKVRSWLLGYGGHDNPNQIPDTRPVKVPAFVSDVQHSAERAGRAIVSPDPNESIPGRIADVGEGAGTLLSIGLAPEMMLHPITAAKVIAGGYLGDKAGSGAAKMLGAEPDTARLVGDLTSLPAGAAAASPKLTSLPVVRGAVNALRNIEPKSMFRAGLPAMAAGVTAAGAAHSAGLPYPYPYAVGAGVTSIADALPTAVKGMYDVSKSQPWTPDLGFPEAKAPRKPIWEGAYAENKDAPLVSKPVEPIKPPEGYTRRVPNAASERAKARLLAEGEAPRKPIWEGAYKDAPSVSKPVENIEPIKQSQFPSGRSPGGLHNVPPETDFSKAAWDEEAKDRWANAQNRTSPEKVKEAENRWANAQNRTRNVSSPEKVKEANTESKEGKTGEDKAKEAKTSEEPDSGIESKYDKETELRYNNLNVDDYKASRMYHQAMKRHQMSGEQRRAFQIEFYGTDSSKTMSVEDKLHAIERMYSTPDKPFKLDDSYMGKPFPDPKVPYGSHYLIKPGQMGLEK